MGLTQFGNLKKMIRDLRWDFGVFSIFFFVFSYRILLDINFIFYLHPNFSHANFELSFGWFSYLFSHLGVLLLFFTLKLQKNRIDSLAWFFFFLVVYLPMSSYYGLSDASSFWFMGVTVVCFFCNLLINSDLFRFQFIYPVLNKGAVIYGGTLLCGVLAVLIISKVDLNFNMSLTDVYAVREEKPLSFIPFSDYLIGAISKVLLPLIILLSLQFWSIKSIIPLALSIGVMILFYFSTGHKGILFNAPFVLMIFLLVRTPNPFFALSVALFLGMGAASIFYVLDNDNLALSLFYRRTLMMPAQLSFYYHDFFTNNYLYLSNSILKDFSHYPYELQPSYEIAQYFFNKPEMASSNGLLSDGFRHFGYLGLLIWMFVFTILLKLLHGFIANVPFAVVLTMSILLTKTLMDGPLLTSLLSHGFLLLFMLFFLMKPVSQSGLSKNV